MRQRGQNPKGWQKKLPKPVSARSLQWLSKRHLERYLASETQLRRVLMRRVNRRLRSFPEDDREVMVALVEAEVKRCVDAGLVNDRTLSQMWVERLRNRGDSTLSIQKKLRQKGISSQLIQESLERMDSQIEGNAALRCALAYAKRRGLGPFRRNPEIRQTRRQKDTAAMMRAGHAYEHIRQVIECEDIDALIERADYGE